jgi:hypothetical protein
VHELCQRNAVILNGAALVKHMIDANLGMSVSRSSEVKRIDTDWFGEGVGTSKDSGGCFARNSCAHAASGKHLD